jgi:hypothetical protein
MSIPTTAESGTAKIHVSLEHVRDVPKVNVFCALSKGRVYGTFFMEATITGIAYLDMLQQFLSTRSHVGGSVERRRYHGLLVLRMLHSLIFPYADSLKIEFVPSLPANVAELGTRIIAAVAEVTSEMVRSVWQETDYRRNVCRITNGSHIEP